MSNLFMLQAITDYFHWSAIPLLLLLIAVIVFYLMWRKRQM